MGDIHTVKQHIDILWPHLNVRQRRLFAANEARKLGFGGIAKVSSACGLSRVTITKGMKELNQELLEPGSLRHRSRGRHKTAKREPILLEYLDQIFQETNKGDPDSLLCWTPKTAIIIADELRNKGHKIAMNTLRSMLNDGGYRIRTSQKIKDTKQIKDSNNQLTLINYLCKKTLADKQPILEIYTKKIRPIEYITNTETQNRKSTATHFLSFQDLKESVITKEIPYGIYSLGMNSGLVNLTFGYDACKFAVNSIRGWWSDEGKKLYKNIKYMTVIIDLENYKYSNTQLYMVELIGLGHDIGIPITVAYFPPYNSKWNNAEHKLFSFIASNWKNEPLLDLQTTVNLISQTNNPTELNLECRLYRRNHAPNQAITTKDFYAFDLIQNKFHGDWNYTLINK